MSTFRDQLFETPQQRKKKTEHKKAINAWTMYDWANSAFATTIMAAVLPVYYSSVAAGNLLPNEATARWAFTTTIALIIVAILSPILGAMADFSGAKKRYFTFFVLFGVTGTALLILVSTGDWILASIFYIVGSIGFSGANVFYDSLLPHIAEPDEIDQVSSKGYAMGYLGGGIMLAVNLAMIMFAPAHLTEWMSRISFFMVAVWWLIFTLPLLRNVDEPPRRVEKGEESFRPIQASINRLVNTFKDIRKYKELTKFIVAFWLYNNGIGTIIYMATIYGTELGFSSTTTIGTLLMVQFVAIPFAFLFGWLGKKLGTKRSILLSIFIYSLIAIGGYFLYQEWHFWALGFAVATVQGGSQALSRSLFGRMMPKSKSAEFYAFFSVSEKIAGTVGPLIFGLVSVWMGSSRLSIVSLIIFFITGGLLLYFVREKDAIAIADEEEKSLISRSAS
ncbi:MAG: MFS transporter [Anaerolineaceae bacterium]|nr:MFS transporter [Anaerolineaceae bacterium]